MEKQFTPEQAKELSNRISDILHQMNSDTKCIDDRAGKVCLAADNVELNKVINQAISERLVDGVENTVSTDILMPLLLSIEAYVRCKEPTNQIKKLLLLNEQPMQMYMRNIKPSYGSVRWFFSGRDAKNKAIEAYNQIQAFLENTAPIADDLHNEILSTARISNDLAISSYNSDSLSMYRLLAEVHQPKSIANIKCINDMQSQYSYVDRKISEAEAYKNSITQQIKMLAQRVLAKNMLEALCEIPVDELNKSKSGLKTGVLASNGYTTVADVYTASPYMLTSIRGISQDGAYTMKEKANELAAAIQEGIKLKISYDNKTEDTTSLVNYLYSIKDFALAYNDFYAKYGNSKKTATTALSDLAELNDLLKWLFISDKEKERFYQAYQYLNTFYESGYGAAINELWASMQPKKAVSYDSAWDDFKVNSISYFGILDMLCPGLTGNATTEFGLPEDLVRAIQDECFFPDGLTAQLRNYQVWGVKYALHQKRALLGDEMGLGKTIQSIATMVSLKNVGETHFLVICPASVLANWCREIVKHSKLRVIKIHGNGRAAALRGWIKTGGVAVTTYETTAHIKLDDSFKIGMITVDEAHYIKNRNAARSKNVRALCEKCDRVLFMTGTALENNVDEMISLIEVLNADIAGELEPLKHLHTAQKFRDKLAPVYFRRKQSDVNQELPDKIEVDEYCQLMIEERHAYEEAVLSKNYQLSRRVSWMINDLEKSCKAQRLKEIIEEAIEEDRKVIVFSFFLDTITKVKELFGNRCTNPINGSISPDRRQEIIDEFTNNPQKIILPAQIQSGGTGLNIQAASVVVICEPQLKPSIENQAIARAHRMGQSRSVIVKRLLAERTIDEKLMDMLKEKQRVFDEFADTSVAGAESTEHLGEIDEATFGRIIEEEIERIQSERANNTEYSNDDFN